MPDAPRNDPSRSYKGNPEAYDQTRSRTPEQRRIERTARDQTRRQANLRGANGIERDGEVVRAGPELTDPISVGINSGGRANGVRLIVIENGFGYFYDFNARFAGPIPP